MTDDERRIVDAAFERIRQMVREVGDHYDIDEALDGIFEAVNLIAPGLPEELEKLTTTEIGNVLARFSMRARGADAGRAGNTPEQSFLALAVSTEIRRRARSDQVTVMEWCRRERIRGFVND